MKLNNDEPRQEKMVRRIPILSILTHNFWLKAASLLFAILLWSYVVNQTNPVRTKYFDNLPVSIQGMNTLNQNGLVPLEDLIKSQLYAKISVKVTHRDFNKLTAESFDVSIDLSGITTTGSHIVPIRVKSANSDVSIISTSPASIELKIDSLDTSVVPLQLNTSGALPDGLIREDAVLTPNTLTLTGPSQYLSRISMATVDVDLSKMTDGYTASTPYTFVDSEGNLVTPVNVNASAQSVLVDMGIKSKKTVSIDYTNAFINKDKIAKNLEIKSIVTSISEITVFGHKDVLDKLDSIKVKPYDLTGASASLTDVVLTPILPDGVSLVNAVTPLNASVVMSEQETSKDFSVQIKYTGLSSTLKAQFSTTNATVTLFGPISKLNSFTAADIQIIFNLAGKLEGTYDLALTPVVSGDNAGVTVSAQPVSVKVTITKK